MPPLTRMPMVETRGISGARNGRGHPGSVTRMIQTAAETTTNANRVPMLTRSARNSSGASAAAAATTDPHQDRRLPRGLESRVDGGEEPLGQQPVAGHRQQDPRLAQVAHQQRAGHPGEDAQRDQAARERQALGVQRRGQRCGDVDLAIGHHPGQDGRDRDVEHRADRQGPQDADGQVALRPPGLLGVRRDRVEADVGEEDPARPLGHAAPAVFFVQERLPVLGRRRRRRRCRSPSG